MFGDEVHHAFAAQVRLSVLLASAEYRLVRCGGEAEFIRPARLARKTQFAAQLAFDDLRTQLMPAAAKDEHGFSLVAYIAERDAFAFDNGLPDGAAVCGIAFFSPYGGDKSYVPGREQRAAVGDDPQRSAVMFYRQHGGPPMLNLLINYHNKAFSAFRQYRCAEKPRSAKKTASETPSF